MRKNVAWGAAAAGGVLVGLGIGGFSQAVATTAAPPAQPWERGSLGA